MFKDSEEGQTHTVCNTRVTKKGQSLCCFCEPHEGCDFTTTTVDSAAPAEYKNKNLESLLEEYDKKFLLYDDHEKEWESLGGNYKEVKSFIRHAYEMGEAKGRVQGLRERGWCNLDIIN